jgi:predicted regulator of Ras-like GTPase activity (Roadblock/LC7/MglB family)
VFLHPFDLAFGDVSRGIRSVGVDLVMYPDDVEEITVLCSKLQTEANAKSVFLVDKNGQLIAAQGDTQTVDTTSLASLTAGNIAATAGLAKLLGETEFSVLFGEGTRDKLHISLVGGRGILVVVFDDRTSLGLVRLRVKKSSELLAEVFDRVHSRSERAMSEGGPDSPFVEITDDDIDNLFQ